MYVSLLQICLNFGTQICFWQQVRFKHKYERKKQVVTVAEKRYEKTTLGTKLPGLNLFLYILILLNFQITHFWNDVCIETADILPKHQFLSARLRGLQHFLIQLTLHKIQSTNPISNLFLQVSTSQLCVPICISIVPMQCIRSVETSSNKLEKYRISANSFLPSIVSPL